MDSKRSLLKDRLIREYTVVAAKALREPRTNHDMVLRIRWERLKNILGRRYDIVDMSQL